VLGFASGAFLSACQIMLGLACVGGDRVRLVTVCGLFGVQFKEKSEAS